MYGNKDKNHHQKMMQMQRQSKQQAIEQGLSHDILGQLLATAEAFADTGKRERLFKAYEYFNSSKKSKDNLREQFLMLTDVFKHSYNFFNHDHKNSGGYEFPENLSKDQIIKLLEKWKSSVSLDDQYIYDKTIYLLIGIKPSQPYPKEEIKNFINKEKFTSEVEIGNFANSIHAINNSNEHLTENISKQYDKNGHYKGKMIIGANGPHDSYLSNLSGDLSQPNPKLHYNPAIPRNKQDL